MRVLMVANKSELGGAPRSMMDMIKNIKTEHEVDFTVLIHKDGGPIAKYCAENGINYIVDGHESVAISRGSTGIRRVAKRLLFPYYWIRMIIANRKAVSKIEKTIDLTSLDIIHTNSNRDGLGSMLYKKYGIKHIWHFREFGKDDYDVVYFPPFSIRYINKCASKFVMISKALEESWVRRGIDKTKCVQIYNGVNTENILCKQRKTDRDSIRFVFTGTVCPAKGQDELIEAISRLSHETKMKITVDFIGDGPADYLRQLNNRCRVLGIEKNVRFLGYRSNISELLKDYDVGVVCSRAEAFGRITPEYMAAGLIVVASNTGANPELVEDGINGFIYNYGDRTMLSIILEKICNLGMDDWDKMSASAEMTAKDHFSDKLNAENIYKLYLSVLDA